MKRCSQCEFTFDNHLQFCDFDNTELTVVPERAPSFTNVSPPPSLFLRVARSRISLAFLAFAGVMLSALLVGYADFASQPNVAVASNAERGTDKVNPESQDPAGTRDQAKPDQAAKPRLNATERRISAEETHSSVTASVFRWEPAVSRSSRSRPEPTTFKREAISPSGVGASKGSRARPNGESLAKRRRRPNPTTVLSGSETRSVGSESGTARQKRNSKVVAILKKTGGFLTRPFKF
jgi:hypothetical protein